jgi:hypothetical protein
MSQVQLTSGSSMGDKGKQKTTYSPQDARSDLPQSHGIQDIPTVVTGSPEKDTSQNQIKFLPKKGNAKAASESALDQNNTVQLSTTVALEETQDQALEAANTQETKTMDTYKTELDSTKSEDNSVDKQVELSGPKEVATTDTTQQSKHDTVASAVSQVDDEKLSRHTTSESPDRESIPSKESSVGSPKSSQVKKDTCRDETASASSTADEESNKSDSTLDLSDRQKRGAQAHYETVSDDEQKNENSFVSAKESLSDVEKVEVKEDTDSMVEGVVPEDSSTMTSGNTGTAHAKPKDASSLLGTSTAPPEKSRVPPAAALPEKKVGAHATESLNPFGLSKVQQRAQRKKEQEAKKKQRKKKDKEREEAKKAKKLDKHILLPSTAFQAGSDQPQATETPALKSEKLETADNHSHAPGSRDGYTEDAKQNLDSKIQVQSKDAKFDQDKRTEASTDVLANPYEGIELGSPQMTPQMAPNQDVHQPPKASSPSQDARSSTPEGCAKQAAQGLEKLYTEETELQQGVKAKKAAPIKVAVPNLKLAVTKSATSSKAPSNTSSPTDALATTVKDSNRTNLAKSKCQPTSSSMPVTNFVDSNTLEAQTILPGGSLEELTKIKGTVPMLLFLLTRDANRSYLGETEIIDLSSEDNVSTATSATIQASLGRASPSPSAADFHTPLQTPSGLASQQAAQPKKKTKRGGKKAKKNALAPPTQPAAAGEPFAEQLKQVEGLTGINEFPYHSSSSGMSYYQSRENVATDSAAANDASNDATPSEARVADNKVSKSTSKVPKVLASTRKAIALSHEEAHAKLTSMSQNNNSVFDEILVYMKEKEQAMDAIPRNILAQHGADIPPVKLSWEQVEHIVGGPNKNSTKFGTEVAGSGDDPAPKASEELPSNDDSEGSNEASSATLSAG